MSTNFTVDPYKYSDYEFAEETFNEFNLNIESIKIYSDAQKHASNIILLIFKIILLKLINY